MFNSVREINQACRNALQSGKVVRVKHDGLFLRIIRARTVKGFLQVLTVSSGEWIECSWADLDVF